MIMKLTPKTKIGAVVSGIVGLGLMAGLNHVTPAPAPITTTQNALAVQDSFRSYGRVPIIPAVELVPAASLEGATAENTYVPVAAWYKSKHWWKKNAPIIGGAAGGGLIGGLAGGGKGALIGGAAGAGGGYLYKHLKDKHHPGEAYRSNHGEAYRSTDQPARQQPRYGR
jgi:hypothetical protein